MKNIKINLFVALVISLFCFAGNVFAQNGGKAKSNRISFAKGKSSAIVTGKIYGDVQAEYVFAASEGQTVTVKISSIPKGKFASFKVLNAYDEPEFASEYDANYEYIFTAPYSGDYLIWVNFRPAGKVNSAKYFLTISIK
ncbi:MAG: hypothetical protein ACR2N3_06965 [Pyrinomonadaceae bacterium]